MGMSTKKDRAMMNSPIMKRTLSSNLWERVGEGGRGWKRVGEVDAMPNGSYTHTLCGIEN